LRTVLQTLEGSFGLFTIRFKKVYELFNINEAVWKTAEKLTEKEVMWTASAV
jgi:hypothetical protein